MPMDSSTSTQPSQPTATDHNQPKPTTKRLSKRPITKRQRSLSPEDLTPRRPRRFVSHALVPAPISDFTPDGRWKMDELLARLESTQFKIDDVGIRALRGIEANSVYAIVWVDKGKGGVVDGILRKGTYMLHLMVAAHDPTHWTSLIVYRPDIVLAIYDKHPGAHGPLWTTREWTWGAPLEMATSYEWMLKWLSDLCHNQANHNAALRICDTQDFIRDLQVKSVAAWPDSIPSPKLPPAAAPNAGEDIPEQEDEEVEEVEEHDLPDYF